MPVLALSNFIAKLASMMGGAFHGLGSIEKDRRERQSHYLDSISETLASAGMAVGDGKDIARQLAELRFHMSEIESVLRLGDPRWLMALDDGTVEHLCAELDVAVAETESSLQGVISDNDFEASSQRYSQREDLRKTFLNASGVFRGAAVALRGRI
jgi:hypothetical protein